MKKYLFPFLINFFIFILVGIIGILCYLNPRLFEGKTLSEYSNNFCQNSSNYESIICKNNYKKKKFILLLIDGAAFDSLNFISNPEEHNLTRIYRNYDTEYKITGANFESMFTGKSSRNYKYKPFNSDNFFKQLHNSGYNLSYLGDKIPVFKFLNNEKNIELNSYKIDVEEISFSNLCDDSFNIEDEWVENYLKKNSNQIGNLKISKEEMYKTLNEYFKNSSFEKLNMSKCLENKFKISQSGEKFGIIYYTTILDHYNHKYSKKHYKTMAQAYSIDSYLHKIWTFIQENPEFALIIGSDHGGNIFPGNDEIISHGSNDYGNEGIFLLYTKDLNIPKNDELKSEIINRYQYASSMPLIIEGINIPLESIEMPILLYNDSFWEDIVIKMKGFQIIQYFQKSSLKFTELKDKFYLYICQIYDIIENKEYDFELKKNKLLKIHLIGIKIMKKKLIPKSYYIYFFVITGFFILKIIVEIYFMKKIIQNKNINFDNGLFYLLIFGLLFPIIILFLPKSFTFENKINFIILSSSFFMLIPINELIDNLKFFSVLIILCNIIAIFSFQKKVFCDIKSILKQYYICKFSEIFCFSIIVIYIYLYFKKNLKDKYFNSKKNYSIYKFSIIFCIFISFLILIFHLIKPFYNEGIRFIILNQIIYILLIFLFIFSMVTPKNINEKKSKKYVLTKIFIILLQTFIIEIAEKIIIIFFFIPLLEIFTYIYEKNKSKYKPFLWQFYLIFFEIFYLFSKQTFDMKSHSNIDLREITINGKILDVFLNVHLEGNFSIIIYSYLFEFTHFTNDKFINSKSMLMRYITYIRVNILSICLLYNIFIQKIETVVIKLLYYIGIYIIFIFFDGLYIFNVYFWKLFDNKKIIHYKTHKNNIYSFHEVQKMNQSANSFH